MKLFGVETQGESIKWPVYSWYIYMYVYTGLVSYVKFADEVSSSYGWQKHFVFLGENAFMQERHNMFPLEMSPKHIYIIYLW